MALRLPARGKLEALCSSTNADQHAPRPKQYSRRHATWHCGGKGSAGPARSKIFSTLDIISAFHGRVKTNAGKHFLSSYRPVPPGQFALFHDALLGAVDVRSVSVRTFLDRTCCTCTDSALPADRIHIDSIYNPITPCSLAWVC